MMTVKELIIKLLDTPDLDVPVLMRGNELHSYDFDVGKVEPEDREHDGWVIVLYEGELTQARVLREQESMQDREPEHYGSVHIPDREPTSRYGVICEYHGHQGLTRKEYEHQMSYADRLWRCPIEHCPGRTQWDDDRYEDPTKVIPT